MATSGVNNFSIDVVDIIEEAYEMVGKEVRDGYDLKTARRSLDLLTKEWANRGINLWTVIEGTYPVEALDGDITLEADTIDVLDVVWRTGTGQNQTDRIMTRMAVSEWAQTANKNTQSTPSRFWVNRLAPAPVIQIWPIPSEAGTLVYWRLRLIEDSGVYTNTMDIPTRLLPAMTAGLAYYLAIKTVGADNRVPLLKAEYDRQFQLASEEDRERASLFLVPSFRR